MSILGLDIGWGELLIILIVALLVVGPEKLPVYARKAARFVRNFQKVTTGISSQVSKAINLDDEEDAKAPKFKKDLIEVKKSLEKDVADLKAELDAQAKAISQTVESGTKAASAQLEESAKEVSDTLNSQAKAVSETMEAASAGLEKNAAGASDTLAQADEINATQATSVQPEVGAGESPETPFASPETAAAPVIEKPATESPATPPPAKRSRKKSA